MPRSPGPTEPGPRGVTAQNSGGRIPEPVRLRGPSRPEGPRAPRRHFVPRSWGARGLCGTHPLGGFRDLREACVLPSGCRKLRGVIPQDLLGLSGSPGNPGIQPPNCRLSAVVLVICTSQVSSSNWSRHRGRFRLRFGNLQWLANKGSSFRRALTVGYRYRQMAGIQKPQEFLSVVAAWRSYHQMVGFRPMGARPRVPRARTVSFELLHRFLAGLTRVSWRTILRHSQITLTRGRVSPPRRQCRAPRAARQRAVR